MSALRSEKLDALAAALAAAQAEFGAVPKNSVNPFYKNRYADLAGVIASVAPVAARHGLSVAQFPGSDEHGDTLTSWLLHESGQFIADTMRLHLSKDDAQGQGSALTYARRYAYMSILGVVADADDDGEKAARGERLREANGAAPAPPGLSEATAKALKAAKAAADMPEDWFRMQLVACGAQNVPEGPVRLATIRALSEQQAAKLLSVLSEVARGHEEIARNREASRS